MANGKLSTNDKEHMRVFKPHFENFITTTDPHMQTQLI